ncbi:MAG: CBS domain-containing protein [Chromatiales bacterium]|jgi:magnesium and cobalt transporter|nr:CBS domain-containing protein [Chromatiales bacterium]
MGDDNSESPSWISRLKQAMHIGPENRQELLALIDNDTDLAFLDKQELSMLRGVLQVSSMQVREIMIPRSQMVVIERDAPREKLLNAIVESGHSRFPVVGENRDEVVGMLLAKDVLRFLVGSPGEEFDLESSLRPATFIPESKRLDTLLEEFRNGRNHIAIVVDEYGGIAGLLTIEDVLEQIVGDIDDEHDEEEAEPIVQLGPNTWVVLAHTRIEDFDEYFVVKFDKGEFETVAGMVMQAFGRLPRRGDKIVTGGLGITVVQADRRRIHSVEVSREESEDTQE